MTGRVTVDLLDRSYDVIVGSGAVVELAGLIPPGARRAAIVTQPGIPVTVDPGVTHEMFEIGVGERSKTLTTVEDLCRRFSRWGLTRGDVVIGVGGGMVTDVAGFAAAVYHRGVASAYVATTLLGQIDAAVGGKTGVNLPEGKNLVGAYWQPTGVICDTDHLATLPERERRSGLGEMAKCHFLDGDDLAALPFDQRVARCIEIKARVVEADEREDGKRAILNYGHTLAHALEIAGDFDLRHGEAVAIGLVYAAEVANRLGRIDDGRLAQHRAVVESYGLDSILPAGSDPDRLLALFASDKKATTDVTFVLDGPSGVEPVVGIEPLILREALGAMRP
ncbi:MAG: 3-dehydroquinate synthase [Acidimicrobiia bacterium]|nr:3-dehydroquinate synthase [Acidimicrobiia bacterium]